MMQESDPSGPADLHCRELTVAHVRERPEADAVEVLFLESARIFRLLRTHTHFDSILSKLQRAQKARRRVRVALASLNGDLIEDLPGPSGISVTQ